MTPKIRKLEEVWVVVIAVMAAVLLASHQLSLNSEFNLATNYIYWIFRILIQASIFIAVLLAAERYLRELLPEWGLFALSIVLSLVPYALTITALDLIVGLPEIGFNSETTSQISTARAFAYELVYLSDNHIALCAILLLPRIMLRHAFSNAEALSENNLTDTQTDVAETINTPIAFIESLEPPMQGDLCTVEAQEHYVQVTSSAESRMVLYRFSDVVRQLPDYLGMQVHRSHWVAHTAVSNIVMQGQTMKLAMKDGRLVPVSRTFRAAVEARFGEH